MTERIYDDTANTNGAHVDVIHGFMLPACGVRGAIVRIERVATEVLAQDDYPALVSKLLAEALAASALMMSNVKHAHRLALQLQCEQGVRLLLAECDDQGGMRGIVKFDRGELEHWSLGNGRERCAITIEPRDGEQRYQGVIAVESETLAAILADYFRRSEQIPTWIALHCDDRGASGLLLQRVPEHGGAQVTHDPDGWNRVQHLAATVQASEWRNTAPEVLVQQVFFEEELEWTGVRELTFSCRCSQQKVEALLVQLGHDECLAALHANGGVLEVRCEFCARPYRFDAVDAERLFHPHSSQSRGVQ